MIVFQHDNDQLKLISSKNNTKTTVTHKNLHDPFYLISESEDWSEIFENEFSNIKHDDQLKHWLLLIVQQTWPFSWIKGQKGLKDIINREINLSFLEEKDFPVPQPSVEIILTGKTKDTLFYKATLGHSEVEFMNKKAILVFEDKAKDVIHLKVMKDNENIIGEALVPLKEVVEGTGCLNLTDQSELKKSGQNYTFFKV